MDRIEKLLRKISRKDREYLLQVIDILLSTDSFKLDIKKLQNSDFYRVRTGRSRIIFHYEHGKRVVIDSVRLRDDTTYNKIP